MKKVRLGSLKTFYMTGEKGMAILMADLSGYTAMTEMHGAEYAAGLISRYVELANKAMNGTSRLLERVGDQLVIVSPEPADIAITALQLLQLSSSEPTFLRVHAGLHFGSILERDGSFYGAAMNLTARIASEAKHGKILCSIEFITKVNYSDQFHFQALRKIKFKNILNPATIGELVATSEHRHDNNEIDPVCHMHVTGQEGFSSVYKGLTYHFCSADCLMVFREDPRIILYPHQAI